MLTKESAMGNAIGTHFLPTCFNESLQSHLRGSATDRETLRSSFQVSHVCNFPIQTDMPAHAIMPCSQIRTYCPLIQRQ